MGDQEHSRWHPILSWVHKNPAAAIRPLRVVEQEAIVQAMILTGGDADQAAERLGISRATMYRKLKELQQ